MAKVATVYVVEMQHPGSPLWHAVEADTNFRRAHAAKTIWQQNDPNDDFRVVRYLRAYLPPRAYKDVTAAAESLRSAHQALTVKAWGR